MRALAKLQNLKSDECKHTIIRYLHWILDIRIIDIDVENGRILFLYTSRLAFQKVKQELRRIGYPIINFSITPPIEPSSPFSSRIGNAIS
ncbi:MAG: hypothetical protein WBM53_15760 [Maribacter sp.]